MLIKVIAIQNIREKMKRCYFCKGKVVEKKVKVDFRWGDELVVIEDVPAEVCQQCGKNILARKCIRKWRIWRKQRKIQ